MLKTFIAQQEINSINNFKHLKTEGEVSFAQAQELLKEMEYHEYNQLKQSESDSFIQLP